MTEKSHENNFKFGLYLDNDIVNESIFSADVFNPVIRYSVDIRNDIPSIINRLQSELSNKHTTHYIEFGNTSYDFLESYEKQLSLETKRHNNKLKKKPVVKTSASGRTYSNVEFKFGLYINNNPIVERNFYVENYNPATRFSFELNDAVEDIVDDISLSLKHSDVDHMWDDYSLINTYGLYINQIRDLSRNKRTMFLANLKNSDFVKKTKRSYSNYGD